MSDERERLTAIRQHMEHSRSMKTPPKDDVWFLLELAEEAHRLHRWKADALSVFDEWDRVHEALGSPGRLGEHKSEACVAEIQRLGARTRGPSKRIGIVDGGGGGRVDVYVDRDRDHGTGAAYRKHYRDGTPVCGRCSAWAAEYRAELKLRGPR